MLGRFFLRLLETTCLTGWRFLLARRGISRTGSCRVYYQRLLWEAALFIRTYSGSFLCLPVQQLRPWCHPSKLLFVRTGCLKIVQSVGFKMVLLIQVVETIGKLHKGQGLCSMLKTIKLRPDVTFGEKRQCHHLSYICMCASIVVVAVLDS